MRGIFNPFAACILLTISVSCSSGGSEQSTVVKPSQKPGVIHEKIACAGDQEKSYALYLPGKTSPPALPQTGGGVEGKTLYPVLIAFDPHGDGKLPLTIYKDLAEKYGFILIGSNDSKNGLSAGAVKEIVAVLMQEIRTVYPVDTNRIWLLGFSGGARVATAAAMSQVKVKGVIACGAGLSGRRRCFSRRCHHCCDRRRRRLFACG